MESLGGFALCMPPKSDIDGSQEGRFRTEADAAEQKLSIAEAERRAKVRPVD